MVNKNIVCIIQARMGSTRLPGKVLMKLNKKFTVLEFLIIRMMKSKYISNIVIACTKKKQDKKIINHIKKFNLDYFKGSNSNVLKRFYDTASVYNADIIVRITSDCPFADPKLIDSLLLNFKKNHFGYYSNINPRSFPDGFDVEIFDMETLKYAYKNAKSNYDLEHVTPYMLKSRKVKKGNFKHKKNYAKLRITLDNKDDLKKIRQIAKKLNPNRYFSWKKMLGLMN
tara:strand:+ start:23075 stop:23755 length:681 start_codon:yes stop_codon:yes gene_type:complete